MLMDCDLCLYFFGFDSKTGELGFKPSDLGVWVFGGSENGANADSCIGLRVLENAFVHFLIDFLPDEFNLVLALYNCLLRLLYFVHSTSSLKYFSCRSTLRRLTSFTLWSVSSSCLYYSWRGRNKLISFYSGSFCSTTWGWMGSGSSCSYSCS